MGRYVLRARGRIRKRGARGGGTLCSGAPQLLQRSERTASTRSQCPRAGHSVLRHCTVQPGKYCMAPSLPGGPTKSVQFPENGPTNPPEVGGIVRVAS